MPAFRKRFLCKIKRASGMNSIATSNGCAIISSIFQNLAWALPFRYALTSNNEIIKNEIINNTDTLTHMARYCLQNILKSITLPKQKGDFSLKKPFLKFVIDKKAPDEITT